MNERLRYILALVVGLLAIPGLALATNSALSDDGADEYTEVLSSTVATATAVDGSAISADDLVRACGVEGRYLVELEAVGATDDIQQAALNALRPICEDASLPLPAGPVVEGEKIIETVTVVRTVPGPAAAPTATATTTSTTLEGTAPAPYQDDDLADALEAREQALLAIEAAIAAGGKVEMINDAISLIELGDAAYGTADYDEAEEWFEEAEDKAIQAQHELEEYEDHDEDEEDDDYEEDEHDEDEHEEHEDDD